MQDRIAAGALAYRVRFVNEGEVYEIYAREVSSGSLFGFVEVAKLVWGGKSSVIVDPNEQSLRNEFEGVKLPGGAKGEGATVFPIYSAGAPKPTGAD